MRIPALAVAILLTSCNAGNEPRIDPDAPDAPPAKRDVPAEIHDAAGKTGLEIRMREADPLGAAGSDRPPPAKATVLSASETEKLLARTDRLQIEDGDRQTFAKRGASMKPPRPGETVDVPFPPPAPDIAKPDPPTGDLKVVRYSPQGEVPLAPRLSVTFDRPMVAVSSQALTQETVPVTIEPQPEGQWRWLGTKTLVFEPTVRFPMSTEYTVTVPSGTESANGDVMGDAKSWTFATPPLELQSHSPGGDAVGLTPVLSMLFDQAIDPKAMLEHVTVKAGSTEHPVRLATDDEIEAAQKKGQIVTAWSRSEAPDDRALYLMPSEPFPKATSVFVSIDAGATGSEGPRPTTRAQGWGFSTYHPLKVDEHWCNWRDRCPPDSGWTIRFNNPLDPKSVNPDTIHIEPDAKLSIGAYSNVISIQGDKPGSTTYTVTLPADIRDQFDQTLGDEESLTFKVGKADPSFSMPVGLVTVLDPDAPAPSLLVYTRNQPALKVRIRKVDPDDFPAYLAWRREHERETSNPPLPGTEVANTRISIDGATDSRVETAIPLADYLDDGLGHLMVWVEGTKKANRWDRPEAITWVQGTRLGVDLMTDAENMVAFASDLSTGEAVQGAEIAIVPEPADEEGFKTTDADGFARTQLPKSPPNGTQILVARKGDDVAFLPGTSWFWQDYPQWRFSGFSSSDRWWTFDDRGLYKPGEKVSLKGFVRRFHASPTGDIERSPIAGKRITWQAYGPRNNELSSGEIEVSAHGGFDLEVELPDTVNLGTGRVVLERNGSGIATHTFRIEEFRRPEFEVSADIDPGPHVLGERANARVTATYFAGGSLPGAQTLWNASASDASYTPPDNADYSFGAYRPWWYGGWWNRGSISSGGDGRFANPSLDVKTDATGTSEIELHFAAMSPPRPMTVNVNATVVDVNRQRWSTSATTLVHPSTRYVGLKAVKSFVEKGDPLEVEAVLTDIDGNRIADEPIAVNIWRETWKFVDGRYQTVREDEQSCEKQSTREPVTCTFETSEGGTYKVEAEVSDDEGRKNTSELRMWVTGGESTPSRRVELENVLLVPNADEYAPGDTAEIFVKAPFAPADAVVTWRRSGILNTEHLRIEDGSAVLQVPIEDAHTPNLHVQVELTGQAERLDDKGNPTGKKRPAFATGSLDLPVPPAHRTLEVDVEPAKTALMPGEETEIAVSVATSDGTAVKDAEVMVAVVDESVLALTGHALSDPMNVFYARHGSGVSDYRMRALVVLADPETVPSADPAPPPMEPEAAMAPGSSSGVGGLGSRGSGFGGGGMAKSRAKREASKAGLLGNMATEADKDGFFGGLADAASGESNEQGSSPITVRSDFSALALFSADVRTNSAGEVTVPVKLPDNLTRYRVMVVAADPEQQFGIGESTITARNPVMVRPSAPRFLNFGDRFELPFVVQNQTDADISVKLAVETTNAAFLESLDMPGDPYEVGEDQAGRAVTVPANDRVEIRLPAAADMAGTARFQAAVSAGGFADAVRFDLPVWTPATSEAFATYGVIDDGAIQQPVTAPPDAWPQFGGLEITTSSTALQALTDAVLYLTGYPYDCSEQLSSRVMSIAALKDVLQAFEADGLPSADEMVAAVDRDLELLSRLQNTDGGFGFWRRGDPSWPYLSIHVAHSLARAEDKGFTIPANMRARSLNYLQNVESRIPSWYSLRYRRTLIAYALYVRELMDDADPQRAKRLYKNAGNTGIPMEALGWILPTLHEGGMSSEVAAITGYLNNNVTETAAGAHFVTSMDDGARHVLLASSRRVDGVVLDALIRVDEDNDLIPKLVNGLLAHRKKGRWGNTQENAFVLLALDRYFRTYEKTTPDFVARAWLGSDYAGEATFQGRETKYANIDVPMGTLTENPNQDLLLQKDGEGRMYYRIGMRYAPKDLELEAADYGFTVERTYEAVDDPDDVTRDDEGVWHVRAGARVRVNLSMVAEGRRYHVALVDPLPAGFEPVNPGLLGSGPVPPAKPEPSGARPMWYWSRTWYEHQNMRDERVEAFASLLWDGVHTYSYVAEATTPGIFIAPPTKAEEMYSPETFGRSATDKVVVEP